MTPTRAGDGEADGGRPTLGVGSNRSGRWRSTSTNSTVDSVSIGDLGEGEVGRALHDEQAGHAVADDAEEQHGREPAADERRRRAPRRRARRATGRWAGRVDQRRASRPTPPERAGATPGASAGGEQDHAGVDRQRAVLHTPVTRSAPRFRPRRTPR